MKDDKVAQFVGITAASASTAAFYLNSCGGSVEAAVQAFYDAGGAEAPASGAPAATAGALGAPASSSLLADAAAARAAHAAAAGGGAAGGSGGAGPSSSRARGGGAAPGNVRGLGDIGDEEDEEDDEYNELYVGGDKSGQVVRGAPKDKDKRRPAGGVEDIFEGARAAGAEQGSYEDMMEEDEEGGQRFRAFSGAARTLAGGEVAPPQQAQGQRRPERRAIKIVFYANGVFTVHDGEPRHMNDPANLPFMEAIMRGQLPPELDPGDPNIQVNVNLLRKDEDYTPPAQPKVKAFSGTAHKLSGDAGAGPSGGGDGAGGPPPSFAATPGAVTWEGADHSQPVTSIQLRLADGSRLRAEFNLSHTVGDIRRFIHASRPDASGSYRLATAFPPKQLDDDSLTVEAAGLANSVIIQK
ncbi:hypothetical protein ABPG75_013391 [Micractinium tetrahymenae]